MKRDKTILRNVFLTFYDWKFMTIFTAISSSSSKSFFYLENKTKDFTFYIAILPFEYINSSAAGTIAADMITQGDLDSIRNDEPKEARSTISLIPAAKFEESLKNEILEFTNHQLSDITYFAVRMFVYDKEDNFIPFFGTISHNEGHWNYSEKIETNVLAYEFARTLPQNNNVN